MLKSLDPTTDEEKQALAAAKQSDRFDRPVAACKFQFALYRGAVSYPLGLMSWLAGRVALFCGFGLMSKGNAMSCRRAPFRRLSGRPAPSIFILDLSSPYSGLFRRLAHALQQVLAQMSQGQGAVGGSR